MKSKHEIDQCYRDTEKGTYRFVNSDDALLFEITNEKFIALYIQLQDDFGRSFDLARIGSASADSVYIDTEGRYFTLGAHVEEYFSTEIDIALLLDIMDEAEEN